MIAVRNVQHVHRGYPTVETKVRMGSGGSDIVRRHRGQRHARETSLR